MPGQDGTGPLGQGAGTGRGLGPCGSGVRRGRGRGFGLRQNLVAKEDLEATKERKSSKTKK